MKQESNASPDWIDWRRDITPPQLALPPDSVDSHCHVFGPQDKFPYSPHRRYTPKDASFEDLLKVHEILGISRRVIVQASCHGYDNSALLSALDASDGRSRGVVSIEPNISSQELGEMNARGVRGVRFNFLRRLVDVEPDSYYRQIVEKIAPLNWHIVVYLEMHELQDRSSLLSEIPVPILFDHMSRPNVEAGLEDEGFKRFLDFLDNHPNSWVKISGPERLSRQGGPLYSDVLPFASLLANRYADRALWGSDWPHPNMEVEAPNDSHLVDFISGFAPTPELQKKVLVTNPGRLYWGLNNN
jgi:2-pyrone-4,6-dicarboxylate lactonase